VVIGVAAAHVHAQNASEQLHALFDREWDWSMQQEPAWASSLGDRRWNDRWPDVSPAAHAARVEHRRQVLRDLSKVDRGALPPADQLNYDIFQKELRQDIEHFEMGWPLLSVINQRGGLQTEDDIVDRLRFENIKDYEDYIARLRAFPALADQTIELMRESIRRGFVHPRIIMQRIPAQIDKQIVDDASASGFYKPFRKFPASIGESDRQRLSQAAADAIRSGIVPGFRRFKQFFETEYLPKCLDGVGIWRLPGGEKLYAYLARHHTTTDLTPDQIHELGLQEVARIRAQLLKIKDEVGFKGSLEDFFVHLRTDPQFFYDRGADLLEGTRAVCKRIDPLLVKLFKTIPRVPYGVEPIPDAIAPDTTTAYYQGPAADGSRAGVYYVNLYKPESRPKWEIMALSLHEAVPGHHFQIARAMELGETPRFRRHSHFTAYIEGWGLYSEHLGDELGLYDDPYSKMGQLTYEMWRAVRLVVDTGIHHKRWTRQQAIEFFRSNAPKSELDITNEIDRYIAWPGQALAYKIGELKIKELRARATKVLGPKFDVKEFHDVILGSGAVPLDVLERMVEEWIDKLAKQ
jgi:prolyl oligopeptidase